MERRAALSVVFVCALCFGRSGLPDELRLVGHLRGYSAEDGKVVWDYDTSHESSGYSRFGGMPGNVLLAFTPDGK